MKIAAMPLIAACLALSGCIADERSPGMLTQIVVGADGETPLECERPGDAEPAPPSNEWPVARPVRSAE